MRTTKIAIMKERINRRKNYIRISTLAKASGKTEKCVRASISKYKLGPVKDGILYVNLWKVPKDMLNWVAA